MFKQGDRPVSEDAERPDSRHVQNPNSEKRDIGAMDITRACRRGKEPNSHRCVEGSMTDPKGQHYRPRRRSNARVALLSALAVAFGHVGVEPAYARECSTSEAKRTAVDYYGGRVVSVTRDGDYMIVRLRLSDGRVIDVAIDRWGC